MIRVKNTMTGSPSFVQSRLRLGARSVTRMRQNVLIARACKEPGTYKNNGVANTKNPRKEHIMDNTSTIIIVIFLVVIMVLELYILGGLRPNNDIEDVTESKVSETTDSPKTHKKLAFEEPPEASRIASETTEETKLYYDVPLDTDLQEHIFAVCEIYDVNPALVISMIARESSFRANAMGDGGESYGLMQIKKKWHTARMEKLGVVDLLDPYQNVTVGIDLLAELLRYGDSLEWALMCYNGGYAYADKRIANGNISDYAKSVIRMSKELILVPYGA